MDDLPSEMWSEILFQLCGQCFPLPTRLDPVRDSLLPATLAALPGQEKRPLRTKAAVPLLAGLRTGLRALLKMRLVSRGMNALIVGLMPRIYTVLHAVFAHVEQRTNLRCCALLRAPTAAAGLTPDQQWRWYHAAVMVLAWPTPVGNPAKASICIVARRTMQRADDTPGQWYDPHPVKGWRPVALGHLRFSRERVTHALAVDTTRQQLHPPYVVRRRHQSQDDDENVTADDDVYILDEKGMPRRSPLRPLMADRQPLPYALLEAEFAREARLNAQQRRLWAILAEAAPRPGKRRRDPGTPEPHLKRARFE